MKKDMKRKNNKTSKDICSKITAAISILFMNLRVRRKMQKKRLGKKPKPNVTAWLGKIDT